MGLLLGRILIVLCGWALAQQLLATFVIIFPVAGANLFFTVASGITTGDRRLRIVLALLQLRLLIDASLRLRLACRLLVVLVVRLGHITQLNTGEGVLKTTVLITNFNGKLFSLYIGSRCPTLATVGPCLYLLSRSLSQ